MHEHGIVSRAAAQALRDTAGQTVDRVTITLGPGVDRAAAEAAWHHAVDGTPLATAATSWAAAHDDLSCFSCGHRYQGTKIDPCPACGGNGLVTEPAADLTVTAELHGEEVRRERPASAP